MKNNYYVKICVCTYGGLNVYLDNGAKIYQQSVGLAASQIRFGSEFLT